MQGAAGVEKGFDNLRPSGYNNQVSTRGVSTSVVRRLPKPNRRVRLPYPAPRRNGLRSIQKARSNDRAFLIPLRHSSFSPREILLRKFSQGPRPPWRAAIYTLCIACGDFFCKNHRALILLLLTSTQNFACANFRGDPGRPGGRQYIRFVSLAAFSQTKKPRKNLLPGLFSFF